ncbi:hypothetical protein V493_01893, partial [Pseudogymnoascus sp. VKM F-4281 (FW-2241)]
MPEWDCVCSPGVRLLKSRLSVLASGFWLLALVRGVVGLVGINHGAGGGVVGELGEATISPPAIPDFVAFLAGYGTVPTSTDTAATPVDTAAITTGAVTGAVNTRIANEIVDTWIITTVSAYVTICPSPTTIVQGVQTYTVVKATTLTITNCPCTISYPAPPAVSTNPPSIVSVPVQPIGTGLLTPSGGIITNYTSVPSANPPAPISFNSTRTTLVAVTGTSPRP